MQIEMSCPRCFRRHTAPLGRLGTDTLEQMLDNAPCYALGDGETLEDMISTTLTDDEPRLCPSCGALLHYSEESLGQLAQTMLTRM